MMQLYGMRLDFQSSNIDAAIINSSLLGTRQSNYAGTSAKNAELVRIGGVLLRGGYIQLKFGALTLCASYVNEYGVQGNREGETAGSER